MSTSLITVLTVEGSKENIQPFLAKTLKKEKGSGRKKYFSLASFKAIFGEAFQTNALRNIEPVPVTLTTSVIAGERVKDRIMRGLLVDTVFSQNGYDEVKDLVRLLSLLFPRLEFQLYADDYQYSAWCDVIRAGLVTGFAMISGDHYYAFDIRESDEESQVMDLDGIRRSLDLKIRNQECDSETTRTYHEINRSLIGIAGITLDGFWEEEGQEVLVRRLGYTKRPVSVEADRLLRYWLFNNHIQKINEVNDTLLLEIIDAETELLQKYLRVLDNLESTQKQEKA